MYTVRRFSFVFAFLAIAISSAASNTDWPEPLDTVYITIWQDGNCHYNSLSEFFKPKFCAHIENVDWIKLKVEIKFCPVVYWTETGELCCPICNSNCSENLLYLCATYQLNSIEKLAKLYCCAINSKVANPIDTCALEQGVNIEQLKTCAADTKTKSALVDLWTQTGKPIFPEGSKFPAFLVNNVYYSKADADLYNDFFGTCCKLFKSGQAPDYCQTKNGN